MSKYLFITWDGPQVSYLEGLFLPIFEVLADHGHLFHVLQFTWAEPDRIAATEAACRAAGVPYRAVKISRKFGPLGPLTTAILGAKHIKKAVRDWQIDTLMPRSLMPALAVLVMRSRKGLRLVYDADGFAADERVDFAARSPRSTTYRALRAVEANTNRVADRVLVRTPRAIEILAERSGAKRTKFHVVINGRNPSPYMTGLPERTDDEFRLCYAGSVGNQYRPDQMFEVAKRLRAEMPNLIFRIFTGDFEILNDAIKRAEIVDHSWIEISRLAPADMPAALMRCDLALALRKPAFSTQGVAPIKLGEYMLAGLPVIGTADVGRADLLIKEGLMLPVEEDLSKVWPWVRDHVLPQRDILRARAQELGLAHFSLVASVKSYLQALKN